MSLVKQLYEEEQEVQDAIQHREMASFKLARDIELDGADGLITAEVMLTKSLRFECAKELIRGLMSIINEDQVNIYRKRLQLTASEHKLMMKAKKFVS